MSLTQLPYRVLFLRFSKQLENLTYAVVEAVKSIANSCIQSGSVKRLIYTGSIVTMSLLNKDGSGYKSSVLDESSWTPPDVPITCSIDSVLVHNPHVSTLDSGNPPTLLHSLAWPLFRSVRSSWYFLLQAYTKSKTLAGKEVLKYNEIENSRLEVVSLDCAVVAGETILPSIPMSMLMVIAPLLGDQQAFFCLKFLQELLGIVPLVHIDDACEALIFCAEKQSMKGRFLCSAAAVSVQEISAYFQENYPEWEIAEEWVVSAVWLQEVLICPVLISICLHIIGQGPFSSLRPQTRKRLHFHEQSKKTVIKMRSQLVINSQTRTGCWKSSY